MTGPERRFSYLVVIGASAGGVESLSAVVATLPKTFPAPIVIAQHLSPSRVSALSDILARRSALPVRRIDERETLQPGVIYVVPANRNVSITETEVLLEEDGQGPHPSIDLLFTSAANAFDENVIAVVLSGSGSDGAVGARDVKYAGGTIIIQNPDTTSYPSMPLALASSIVDIVANPERIGELLNELVIGTYVVPPPTADTQLQAFLEDLRDQSGVDFSPYKQPTIERRLQRRMAATRQQTIADYVRYVHHHPEERQRLVSSFLIKVTEFFRDPELYTYLTEHVLPELIRSARERGGDLRIWSAGCATGEEAYSLAITVADLLGDGPGNINVRIFATDLDDDAVAFARRGIYPARALAKLPHGVLERHFIEHGENFEVRKALRSRVIFGEHDLAQRAPFPRIDLTLCRNVLIYFTPALQRRALQLFAFSLRPGGYLVVGKTETVHPLADYFAVDQPRMKVYRRIGERALIPPSPIREAMPVSRLAPGRTPAPRLSANALRPDSGTPRPHTAWHGEQALLGLPFGVVIVDQRYDIWQINAEARRLFGIHAAALDLDFIHLIQNFDSQAFKRLIDETRASSVTMTRLLPSDDQTTDLQRTLEVTCFRIDGGDDANTPLTVLSMVDVTARERAIQREASAEVMAARLSKANEEVLVANQQLTLRISKLSAENEDLLVASEEIQAATEEVETLNEELQASNEELETLNEELQATVEELNTTNDDLQARTIELQTVALDGETARQQLRIILDNLDSAVVVVDANESIVVENRAFAAFLGSLDRDAVLVGPDRNPLPQEASPIARAARGADFTMEFARKGKDDLTWFIAHGQPIPSRTNETLGVITIREIPLPPDAMS